MRLSMILPILVTGVGLLLLIELRGFPLIRPRRVFCGLASALRDGDGFRSFSLALAGTLGVGNIFGVAAGIIVGGAGSVFWLFVSSIFAMVIKYAETVLAIDRADDCRGGMHLVLRSAFPRLGGGLAVIYATVCLVLAFSMGFAMQSTSVITIGAITTGLSPFLLAALLIILLIPGVLGGGARIEKITAFAIPLTTIIYIIMSFAVIVLNFSELSRVISDIVSSAFSPLSMGGGVIALLSSAVVSEGYSRGILSNEAGVGTSAMAHSRASEREPAVAGLCGMCEVFFDTLLLCTLTALAILTAVPDAEKYTSPMGLVTAAYSGTLGAVGGITLLLCILLFAYSTIVCWYYYGSECVRFLLGGRGRLAYTILFVVFVFIGALGESAWILTVTDFAILIMSVLTLLVLAKDSDRITRLTELSGLIPRRSCRKREK